MSLLEGKVFTTRPELLGTRDTGPARLPGLSVPTPTGNPSLDTWLRQATEVIEVRNGARGNPWERTVTVREFAAMAKEVEAVMPGAKAMTDLLSGKGLNSGEATRMIEAFTQAIKSLPVYKDLIKRLDDPSRFDNLPAEIREELLRSIAEEAAKRGAAISRVEAIMQDANRSLAYEVKLLTAALDRAQAGIREVQFATAEYNFAQAGKITQLEASLGNYYQDGAPGRALLEEQMTVTADALAGLSSQYTIKVQAGKYVAGIGLAATEGPDGNGTSAMIVAAEKFAIVNPATYTAGLTNTPDPAHIPFGVDSSGIYLNNNVYVRGSMRIDTGGKTLADGLRGSVMVAGAGHSWSDSAARTAVWTHLGNSGTPPNNNHLVIGDSVTIGGTTKHWMGGYWEIPGVVLNGSMLVNGSVSAQKIDTRGLDIRDANGNVIFSAGTKLDASRIQGLGAMAWANQVNIGWHEQYSHVTLDGQKMRTSDFVNILSKINATNITTFIESAAIGNAYIGSAFVGNASIDTLRIRGKAVTVPRVFLGWSRDVYPVAEEMLASGVMDVPEGSSGVLLIGNVALSDYGGGGEAYRWHLRFYRGGTLLWTSGLAYGTHDNNYGTVSASFIDENPPAGSHTYSFRMYCIKHSTKHRTLVRDPTLVVMGAYR